MDTLIAIVLLFSAADPELTAEQIVARHVAARGGAARIAAVRTLVFSGGTYREGSFVGSGNDFMAFMKPYYRVVGDPENPKTVFLEGYDGSACEIYRDPGVVVRTVGHAAGATRRGTYIEWRLGNFATHGATIEKGADETIGGRAAYRLIVTSRDGFGREYFIDKENFLLSPIAIARRFMPLAHQCRPKVDSAIGGKSTGSSFLSAPMRSISRPGRN